MLPPVVVGAGVAGLTAGAVLHREGYEPTVVERDLRPADADAGILVGTNGVRVLYHLGLAERLASAGQPLSRARILDAGGRTLTRLEFSGFEGRLYDRTPLSVNRPALEAALRSVLPDDAVEYDRECTGTAHQGGDEQVQFADGDSIQTSLVVGADGVRSDVRRSLFPEASVRPTGWFAYRGVAAEAVEDHLREEVWQVWGPRTRVRFAPIGPERVGWTLIVDDKLGPDDHPDQLLAALSERCVGYPEPVRTLLARTDPGTVAVEPVLELSPLERWHGAAIAVAGDAAHASVPWLGYDRGLGMVDAYMIGERLRGVDSIAGALERYQVDRKPVADWFATRSRQLLRISTLERAPFRGSRNLLLRLAPGWTTHQLRRRLSAID